MAVVVLPKRLDTAAAAPLHTELVEVSGQSVTLKADSVEHLGALCLELLLTAACAWSSSGLKLEIDSPSAALESDLRTFGLAICDISTGVTA